MSEAKLLPLIDLAYQGLGSDLDTDVKGTRRVLAEVKEALVAYSCDKNFGLYRERTGALFVLGRDADAASTVRDNLLSLARVNWSMPPDHGAAVVRIILGSDELAPVWRAELAAMRRRIAAVREALAAADPSLAFLARQCGMFSLLPMMPASVAKLRRDHAIYVADSGRINIAGLRTADACVFVTALADSGVLPDCDVPHRSPAQSRLARVARTEPEMTQ